MQQSNGQKAKNQEVPQAGRLVFSKMQKCGCRMGKPELQNQNNYTKCPPIRRTVVPARNALQKRTPHLLSLALYDKVLRRHAKLLACCWAEKLSWTVPKLACKERPLLKSSQIDITSNFRRLRKMWSRRPHHFLASWASPDVQYHENTGNSVCLFGRSISTMRSMRCLN